MALAAVGKDKAKTEKITNRLTTLNSVFLNIMCLLKIRPLNKDERNREKTNQPPLKRRIIPVIFLSKAPFVS